MFENGPALYLLLILLPVIILYILKPKPRAIKIPSLLLLQSSPDKRRLRTLFDKLIKDPLLLIQLLAMTILILGIAGPFYFTNAEYDCTVIVLDSSASMSATDVKPDRFTHALEIAMEYTGKSEKNSLILAQNMPVLLYNDENSKQAIDRRRGLKPEATGTDLNEAIMFAIDLIGKKTCSLVIISDFSGQDISGVQKIIESENIPAEYRQIGIGGSNLGIIDASIEDNSLGFVVRNYNDIPVDAIIKIMSGDSVKTIKRTIKPEFRDFFKVEAPGTTRISLEPDDDFSLDNMLYISRQDQKNKRILLLSDSPGKSRSISKVFESIPALEIDKVSFDRAPRNLDYGMVVLYDYTGSSFLPGTMEDIEEYVRNGGIVVFEAANDLPLIDAKQLLPVNVSGFAKPSRIDVKSSALTNDIDFGLSKYLKGTIKEGAVEMAFAKEGPILAYHNIGKGKVVYIGTNEDWGDFHLRTSYPIFWYRLLEFQYTSSEELNFKSGTMLPLDSEKSIKGPHLSIRTDKLYLGETGFYDIEGKTIASNLLDEKESDISIPVINFTKIPKLSGGSVEKIHLYILLSLLAILLIFLELYYLKYRGEI